MIYTFGEGSWDTTDVLAALSGRLTGSFDVIIFTCSSFFVDWTLAFADGSFGRKICYGDS